MNYVNSLRHAIKLYLLLLLFSGLGNWNCRVPSFLP